MCSIGVRVKSIKYSVVNLANRTDMFSYSSAIIKHCS